MKVCVLLPAYTQEKEIGKLINDIQAYGFDVIVVDDGSSDNTADISRKAQALVISHQKNKGKGQALRTGFKFIQKNAYDAALIMDSDGQHLPHEINLLIDKATNSDSDIIIGNRMDDPQGMPLLISFIAKPNISDSQCGFRLIRSSALKKLNLSTVKYDTESEILIQAAKQGCKITSVPIKSIYSHNSSLINPIFDTFRFCNLIIKSVFSK